MDRLQARHPSVKEGRAIGLFGMVDLQKNKKGDPLAPYTCGACTITLGLFPIGTPESVITAAYNANLVRVPGVYIDPVTGLNLPPEHVTDKWTGRATVNWTPKLDWTDQTTVYATASRGELAGGVNNGNISTTSAAPRVFNAATVDALEVGTKNTLLDGTLTANLDAWYYNYENYQVTIIANRSSQTLNIPAHLYGVEGEFVWQPTEALSFNMSLNATRTGAGNAFAVDQRNAVANFSNAFGGAVLVKDTTTAINCVLIPNSAAVSGHTPGESSLFGGHHVNGFYLPNGGNAAIDAPYGIPLTNYGDCNPTDHNPALMSVTNPNGTIGEALHEAGWDYAPSVDPHTGLPIPSAPDAGSRGTGIPSSRGVAGASLKGNQLPNTPRYQVGFGAQYIFGLDGGYTLTPRVDYYWQSSMQSRVWNDPNVDLVHSWDVTNLSVNLVNTDNNWYAKLFATNVFNKQNPTGSFVTDQAAGLWTNVFAEDPRVVGISLGASW